MVTRKPGNKRNSSPAKHTPMTIALDTQFQARDDMHTLKRAHEIEQDSKRMEQARKEAEREAGKLKAIISKKKTK